METLTKEEISTNHSGKHLLLGSAGTAIGFAAVCAVRKVWGSDVRVISADTNPKHLCTASLLADFHEQTVPFNDERFPKQLADIIDRHGIDTYLPLFPDEIRHAANFVDTHSGKIHYDRLIPKKSSALLCADKLALFELLKLRDIPTPRFAPPDKPFGEQEYFVKPRCGHGSVGATTMIAEDLIRLPIGGKSGHLIQEICSGPEITVDAFFDSRSSDLYSVCRERIEVKRGVCTKARLFADQELENMAFAIAEALRLEGSFCFQVMHNNKGRWVVIDVNPRPGAGTAISVASGNDFFAAAFANAWAEDYSHYFRTLDRDLYVTRQYTEFVMSHS